MEDDAMSTKASALPLGAWSETLMVEAGTTSVTPLDEELLNITIEAVGLPVGCLSVTDNVHEEFARACSPHLA